VKFTLACALHNHQPVGNFDRVVEAAYQDCYLPFIQLARRFPRVRFSFHQSGILWQWQQKHHPEFFPYIEEMISSGQIELLTGAFYEPILPAIPDRDKSGQLAMLTTYLNEYFRVTPRGMWLAERVWEPNLPAVLHDGGVDYLPLDDTHFKYAGLKDEQLFGPFITEEAGKTVTLLPIQQKLRYLIPFGLPEDVISYLRQAAERHPDGMAVYADDGEKFGVWPDTFRHCYTDRWLERFFTLLEQNADWLQVVPLGEAVTAIAPIGRVYLPTASYKEMLQWALPADSYVELEQFEGKLTALGLMERFGHFVRGGHWRGFLAKYPEANLMHKKMLAVSDLYHELAARPSPDAGRLARARDLLYAGQCNCPYWHGVFGGLYLPHLRQAVYRCLVEAETILLELSGRTVSVACEDRDRDGHTDIVLSGRGLGMVLSPHDGGRMLELDSRETGHNLTDCLARRHEGYHHKLLEPPHGAADDSARSIHDLVMVKENGLERYLVNDTYLRRPLSDHFLPVGTTLDDFAAVKYDEWGDFVCRPYDYSLNEREEGFEVALTRHGRVGRDEQALPLTLAKTILFPRQGETVTIQYRLTPSVRSDLTAMFGVEFDFNLLAPEAHDRFAMIDGVMPEKAHLAAMLETSQARRVAYLDRYQQVGIAIETDRPGRLWRMPIYTVSLSEAGFEKVFQGNCTMFLFQPSFTTGEDFVVRFALYTGPLAGLPESHPAGQVAANRS
jgi:alpha-amylase